MAKKNDDTAALGCAFTLTALVFAMPFIGIYHLMKKDTSEEDKILGAVLTVFGFFLWFIVFINQN